jgi:hypothetical protein
MTYYFYQQKDQKVLMFPETTTYLTPLNGTIVTANPATYPWYSRINIIKDGMDWDMPIQLKEKIWDIGAGKHPSHIINTIYEPIEFTIETEMVDARFMALATGATSSAGTQAAIQVITCGATSTISQGDYFLIYCIDGSGHVICNAVWFDIDAAGTGAPSITGATNIEVDITTGLTAGEVGDALQAKMDAEGNYGATDDNAGVVTITNAANGAVPKAYDSGAAPTAFTFSVTTYGASTQTVTEATTTTLQSFGLHIECNNATDTEDIVVDLHGCIVKGYEVNIDYANKTIKESVTIGCPYYTIGAISTNPPPKRTINPHLWQDVVEVASTQHLIMLGTTDKTPKIVNKAALKIENEVDWQPEIGTAYAMYPVSGKRNVSLNLVGFIQKDDLWEYWYDTWDDANGYYTNAGAKLNTQLRVQRTATYDLWEISVVNWLIETYNLRLFTIDDKILGIDITFTGATPDANGYIIDSLSIKDYVAKIYYNVANA